MSNDFRPYRRTPTETAGQSKRLTLGPRRMAFPDEVADVCAVVDMVALDLDAKAAP